MKKLSIVAAVAFGLFAPRAAHAQSAMHRPELTLGAELGFGHFVEGGPFGFDGGTGSVTQTGPVWGLRAGVDFLPWVGIEGRYVGMWNSASTGQGYAMTGGELVVRLTIPTPYVHPYIFGGVGYYDFALVGRDPTGASQLVSSSQPGFPMGIGLDVPVTKRLSLAVEGTFRFQLGESYAPTNEEIDGADQTTLTAVVKLHL